MDSPEHCDYQKAILHFFNLTCTVHTGAKTQLIINKKKIAGIWCFGKKEFLQSEFCEKWEFATVNYEFCQKWEFENVNFVKNDTLQIVNFVKNENLKMWISCKMRFDTFFPKCEFCDNLDVWNRYVIFWIIFGFLLQCVCVVIW